jgi:hypothetical protein
MTRRYGLDCISYLTDTSIEPVQLSGEPAPKLIGPETEVRRFMAGSTDLAKLIERKEREVERLRELLQTQQPTASA